MAGVLFRSAFSLSLFTAILEQILWRGESNSFYFLPFTFLLVECFILFSRSKKYLLLFSSTLLVALASWLAFAPSKSSFLMEHGIFTAAIVTLLILLWVRIRGDSSKRFLPILFTVPTLSILCFSFLANLGQREYFTMAHEPVGLIVYSDLWVLLALLSLALLSWSSRSLLPLFFTFGAILLCSGLFYSGTDLHLTHLPFINPAADHQLRLATLFSLLIFLNCLWLLPRKSASQTAQAFSYRADIVVAYSILIGSILYVGLLAYRIENEPCIHSSHPYPLSEEMALHLFIAEDPLFYFHHGVEFHGMRMVTARYFETGSKRFGGSSLSMQLAKVCYLPFEKTFSRKLKQVILGILLELRYSKKQIMHSYLENIAFSPHSEGLKDAAERYFSKLPSQLNASEAMTLVLSIQDPFFYNPESTQLPAIIQRRKAVTRARVRVFRDTLIEKIKHLCT